MDNGGVVGLWVLLDIASYAEKHNITFPIFESSVIPFSLVKQVAEEQQVSFRPGDILFIRIGFTKAYEKLSVEEGIALGQRPASKFAGIESSEETLRWLWANQFAAVVSDAVAVESSPVDGPQVPPEWSIHQWCLAGWGMPLGEMFYLEKLASHCAEKKRWTFFFSSVPLNVSPSSPLICMYCLLTWILLVYRFLGVWLVHLMLLLLCDDIVRVFYLLVVYFLAQYRLSI